jgi:hypothetical protein
MRQSQQTRGIRRKPRERGAASVAAVLVALVLAALESLGGCGEKIAIPEASGLFGVTTYYEDDTFAETEPVQVAIIKGYLFVLSGSGVLTKRTTDYVPDTLATGDAILAGGLADPTALCQDDTGDLVFVWEQETRQVSVFASRDLSLQARQSLPEIRRVSALCCCKAGIAAVAGARTFLYLADPDSFVVHRYVYDDFNGLSAYGILTRRFKANGIEEGSGLRFVHRPAGMTRDHADSLLVCDQDTLRNWVIRFNATPDYLDVTPSQLDQDPWRGLAVRFGDPSCAEEVSADYTLGKAEECGGGWTPGPSSEPGEFTRPQAVTVDGSGRIYVADTDNDRIQIFAADGEYLKLFGDSELTTRPTSLAVADKPKGSQYYGGYVFVVLPDSACVRKFISSEQREYERHIEPEV